MLESARLLAGAGADFVRCPDNAAHLAWDHVQAKTRLPWLHIAGVLGDEAARRGFRRVGILVTRYPMAGPVYSQALGKFGIEAVVPRGRGLRDRGLWGAGRIRVQRAVVATVSSSS